MERVAFLMRISNVPPALFSLLLPALLLSACRPQPAIPPTPVPPPSAVSQLWSSSVSSQAPASSASSDSSRPAETIGEHEATPDGVDSLEVATTATGKTLTGRLTSDGRVVYGDAAVGSAKPVMLEFFDYDCEYCRLYARTDRPWIDAEYVQTGRMNVERVLLPMTSAGTMMAQAALCAGQQGKFESMDAFLMSRLPKTQEPVYAALKGMGVNANSFKTCMDGPALATDENGNLGDMNVVRVPAFRIDKTFWPGVMQRDELKKTIDGALKETYNR